MNTPAALQRWWLILSGFYLTLWVHLGVYRFVQGQCMSASCGVLAISQIVLGAAVLFLTLTFHRGVTGYILKNAARLHPAVYLGAAAVVLFGVGLNLRPEWVYAHMSLALSALLTLLYLSVYGARLPKMNAAVMILGTTLLIIIVVAIRVRALAAQPSIHILDEPWTLSWAVSYLRTGQPGDWIMGSVSGSPYYSLPRYYGLVAAWLQVVGVGLWEGRLFSFIVAALTIALTTAAARSLFDRRTAAITLVVLLASSVLLVGFRLRHDIGVSLAIAASLWVYAIARQRGAWSLHLLAGVLVGSGLGAHYHAVGLGAALAAGLYLPDYVDGIRRKQFIPASEAIAFCVGAAAAGLMILALQVLPDVEQFRTYLAPRSPRSPAEFLESLVYHPAQVIEHSQLEFVLVLFGAGAALLRRTKLDLSLALCILFGYLALGVMASKYYGPFDYYSVPLVPIFGLLVGRLFAGLRLSWMPPALRESVVVVGSLCFLVPQLAYSLHAPLSYLRGGEPLRPPPPPAAQWLLENVPREQTVAAEHLYFLWLHEYPFLSPLTPLYLPTAQGSAPESDAALRQVWTELAPDIVIYDPTLATAGVMSQLVNSGYLEDQGFDIVFTETAAESLSVTVYQRK